MKKATSVKRQRPDNITQHRALESTLFDNQVALMTMGIIGRSIATNPDQLSTRHKTYVTSYSVGVRATRQAEVYFLAVHHRNHETQKPLGWLTSVQIADYEQGELIPRKGFCLEDAQVVKGLVDALSIRKETDLPNLTPVVLNTIDPL